LYPAATVLAGERAQVAAVLAALARHDAFHFGGHAVSLEAGLGGTLLLLAPGPADDGTLPIDLLREAPLARTRVVVLAACRSLSGFGSDREGPAGVAGAFFAAGAPAVVAALWQVEDRSSLDLMRRLHRRVARGEEAVSALRQVMLESLRDPDPAKRSPSYWAAYAVLGV
ncbi:MAG: CHAT domain-containing protein, partial [Anaerolineales bacterium]